MSSTVRNGFSTLNRLLGKKNKDSSMSKSTSNLSKSTSNLDSSSQHNKIMPLAASNNAPFEQTFRITICLPRDQLYVVRVGAKTKLKKLLEMVCVNKQLDENKFEFRHPGDASQVFNNELTIGEVGLNEIRLAQKTDRYDTYIKFNTDEIVKLRHNSRESLSSSELSKNSKQYLKTTSPYSSTNSLNSIDSSGMSSHSRSHPPVAPTRKKRVAPRPPSQNSIPENQPDNNDSNVFKKPFPIIPQKNFHVSSPNLSNPNETKALPYEEYNNNNNNNNTKPDPILETSVDSTNYINRLLPVRPMSMGFIREDGVFRKEEHRITYAGDSTLNHSRTSSDSSEVREAAPEPTPRKRPVFAKKRAPAPPPRGLPPVAPPRSLQKPANESTEVSISKSIEETVDRTETNPNISKVMLNMDSEPTSDFDTTKEEESSTESSDITILSNGNSIDVVDNHITLNEISLLNNNKSDSSDEEETKIYNVQIGKPVVIEATKKVIQNAEIVENMKNESKEVIENQQNKVELEEIKPNEIPTSPLYSNKTLNNLKESTPSPRAESPLWTYTLPAPPTFADKDGVSSESRTTIAENGIVFYNGHVSSDNQTIISDSSDLSDLPIKPIIKERLPLDFQVFSDNSTIADTESVITSDIEDGYQVDKIKFSREALLDNLERRRDQFIENEFEFLTKVDTEKDDSTKNEDDEKNQPKENNNVIEDVPSINNSNESNYSIPNNKTNLIEELNDVIINNKLDTVIKKSEEIHEIECVRPTLLSNFSIKSYTNQNEIKTPEGNVTNFSIQSYTNQSAVKTPEANVTNFSIQSYTNQSEVKIPEANVTNFSIQSFTHQSEVKTPEANVTNIDEIIPKKSSLPNESSTNDEIITNKLDESVVFRKPKEFTQMKRSSLTTTNGNMFKSPKIIRSDSFHSTQNDYIENLGLTPRTSSYISLIGSQKYENRSAILKSNLQNSMFSDTNRRKSTSELSIADSPSLQSLLIMKSILNNSRKSSLNDVQPVLVSTVPPVETINLVDSSTKSNNAQTTPLTERKCTSIDINDINKSQHSYDSNDSSKENSPQNKIAQKVSENVTKTKVEEIKKTWKYQGPPAINLSTWGERPKSQIAIKSDTDYKFGGNVTMPRPHSISYQKPEVKNEVNNSIKVIHKQVNSLDEDNYRLPIVRAVEYKKNISPLKDNLPNTENVELRRPSYEISTFITEKRKSETNNTQPTLMSLGRVQIPNRFSLTNSATQTFTSQRPISYNLSTNTKYGPVVKGFKSDTNNINEKNRNFDVGHKSLPANVSATQNYSERIIPKPTTKSITKSLNEKDTTNTVPFSQFTLRKTGLKDKILAENNTSNIVTPKAVIETVSASLQLRQQTGAFPVTPKTVSDVVLTTAPPPPPPTNHMAPVIRSVTTKNNLTIQIDPRDQLLDSIRNFNKLKLKGK